MARGGRSGKPKQTQSEPIPPQMQQILREESVAEVVSTHSGNRTVWTASPTPVATPSRRTIGS